tara:strand:- start:534 stop:1163 length:630 start_codon:yes stop_codon:yes gene_type:complete
MNTSLEINEIAKAMAAAQGAIKNPAKDKNNPHFNKPYADIASGLDVIRPALSANGIAFFQATDFADDYVILTTRLVHTSGQWIEGTYPVGKFGPHQQMAASLTYSKRQALFAIVGVHGEDEDQDGNDAGQIDARNTPKPAAPTITKKDSEALLGVMQDTLAMCESPDSVRAWVAANRSAKAKLLPEHQDEIGAMYRDRLADVLQPIAAE